MAGVCQNMTDFAHSKKTLEEQATDDCSTSSGEACTSRNFRPLGQNARDFYYKGWRGDSDVGDDVEDPLQVALRSTGNGRNLRQTLQKLLESGGDERSIANPATGLTKYHTPTAPCEGIHRSCCTSNVPTKQAFSRGLDVLRQLLLESKNVSKQEKKELLYTSPEDLFRKMLCDLRERLRSVFELSFEDLISLFPSGTDAELLPALLAWTRADAQNENGGKRGAEVFSVLTAAGEVGSGTAQAATGQHFAKKLPSGGFTSENDRQVFDANFSSVELGLREMDGRLLSMAERDQKVTEAVECAASETGADGKPRFGCIVVHIVVGSKTGRIMPSSECIDRLVQQYGSLVLPVVDACQGRLRPGLIREWLDKDRMVLCTGSKFFGGPPFSGVCLHSERLGRELEGFLTKASTTTMLARSKLKEYVVSSLLSDDLPRMRSLLPQKPLNYGVLMRWTFALNGMESYFVDVPREERFRIMQSWTQHARGIIESMKSPFFELLNDGENENATEELDIALSTIVSFHCRCNRDDQTSTARKMTMDELRHVQFLMASDLSKLYPHMNLLGHASTRCFMGQPVELTPGGAADVSKEHVLRIALSAPVVVRMWIQGREQVFEEDRALFEKLQLILGNWNSFQTKPTSAK